jgi:glycosyltransferase involved in cell wall biosynthesis
MAVDVPANEAACRPAGGEPPPPARPDGGPVTLSVLLPVRNEGANLRIMLRILRSTLAVPHEILVVVDSPDDTGVEVTRALRLEMPALRLVHNDRGRGVVNALRAGVAAARGRYVLVFAADEVGPVLAVEDMLALMDAGCDLTSCTRYAHGGRRLGGSFLGGLLSRLANGLLRCLGGCALTDASTGIKMFRRDIFDRLGLESKPVGWVVALEMALKAQLLGLKLGEVPIVSIDRLYGGKSSFRLGPWCAAYFGWLLWGVWKLRTTPGRSRGAVVRVPQYK